MIILTILLLIYVSAVTDNKAKSAFYSRITLISMCISTLVCYNNLYVTSINKGISLYNGLLNITSVTLSFNLFMLIITSLVLIYNTFSLRSEKKLIISSIQVIQAYVAESEESNKKDYDNKLNTIYNDTNNETLTICEYSLIISFILTGACFLMSSGDIITLFIAIELQSYGLYILSTLYKDSEQATWGGLTYFLLGGLSSCFILLGSSLIYINTGNTSLDGFYIITSITEIANNVEYLQNTINHNISHISNQVLLSFKVLILYDSYYINLALIILSAGFLFKVSAAPFHFWSPDVYDAIPTTVTTYVAIIAKLSIFVLLLELVYYIDGNMQTNVLHNEVSKNFLLNLSWKDLILLSSLLSLLTGSILGLTQYRIKRLYAYSTISHVGFILLALCINRAESVQAYLFYILSYTISNLNAFMILVAIGYTMYFYTYNTEQSQIDMKEFLTYKALALKANKETNKITSENGQIKQDEISFKLSYDLSFENLKSLENNNSVLKDIKYSPIQLISQLKGYFYINTYLALSLAITLFSFIGIPPLIGFFAKQMVLSAALDNGYIFITLIGIITSVIAAAYYLNIIKLIFFFKSDYIINPGFLKSIYLLNKKYTGVKGLTLKVNNVSENFLNDKSHILNYIKLSNPLCLVISILTVFLLAFIFVPNESLSLTRILSVIYFI